MGIVLLLLLQASPQDLVEEYFNGANVSRRKSIEKELDARPWEDVDKAIRSLPVRGEPVEELRKARTDVKRVSYKYHLFVPKTYDPARSYRLLVSLHGWKDRGRLMDNGALMMKAWRAQAEKEDDLIVVAPTTTRHIWGEALAGHSLVFTAIREVTEQFRIDPDRIYLDGFSTGARGSFDLAAYYPDRFAAIAPRAGVPRMVSKARGVHAKFLENLRRMPIYWVYGKKDPALKGRWTWFRKELEKGKHDVEFAEHEGGHEWMADETPRVASWMKEQVRNPYPATVEYLTLEKQFNQVFWVRIDSMKPGRTRKREYITMSGGVVEKRSELVDPVKVLATIKDNRIEVTAREIRKLTLFLHDRMMDLSRPVEIVVNGKTLWNKRVDRSNALMLQTAFQRDRGMFFSSSVTLTVK